MLIRLRRKPRRWPALAVAATLAGALSSLTHAATDADKGKVDAGREVALHACTGCHVVASDQPFKPVYPKPLPDFRTIANKPNSTATSLQHFLTSLPAVPKRSQMPNLLLSSEDLRDVSAYIMSLRDLARQDEKRPTRQPSRATSGFRSRSDR
jgi:mono/diheme cytochrome c family protein